MVCCRWAGPGCREGNLGELSIPAQLCPPESFDAQQFRTVPVGYVFFQPYLKYYSSLC